MLSSVMGKKIICYPLKPNGGSKWNDYELRCSLRSIAKHWKGEYDSIVILGAWMPDWVNEEAVEFKLAPQYLQALRGAVELAGEGGDILWMNDDILFMQDTDWSELVKPARRERCPQMTLGRAKEWCQSDNGWMRRLGEIMLVLHENGEPTWKFSTHTPYWYEADKLGPLLDEFGHLGYKVAIENAYYNRHLKEFGAIPCQDKFRAGKNTARFPMGRYSEVRFLNLTPCVGPWMKGFIRATFPTPCRFER